MTIICDSSGMLLAASNVADGWLTPTQAEGGAANEPKDHYARIFGPDSDLTHWIARQMEQGRKDNGRAASSNINHNGEMVKVKLECLNNAEGLFGYALQVSPQSQADEAMADRERWHDIKNHIGSLKLYATFLQKKLPDSEDKQVVGRLLKAIDTLADQLTRMRRGDRT